MEKITVIYGGKSFEHDISIRSYKSFVENINKKYQLSTIYVDKDGLWYENNKLMNNIVDFLKEQDVIFPLIHGNIGEDGKLQGLFETFDIKYVGSNTISSALAMDKAFCKIILDKYNIKQVPYVILNKKTKIKEITSKLNYPVIVKPANGGSSIGISIANNARELVKALSNAFKYDKISYRFALENHLRIMDTSAFEICEKNDIKLIIYNANDLNNIIKVCNGETIGTIVEKYE